MQWIKLTLFASLLCGMHAMIEAPTSEAQFGYGPGYTDWGPDYGFENDWAYTNDWYYDRGPFAQWYGTPGVSGWYGGFGAPGYGPTDGIGPDLYDDGLYDQGYYDGYYSSPYPYSANWYGWGW